MEMEQRMVTAKKYNMAGRHREAMDLLGPVWHEDVRSLEAPALRQIALGCLYYYAEAAILGERFEIAVKAAERFETMLAGTAEHEVLDQDLRFMRTVLQGAVSLFGPWEGRKQGLHSLGSSLAYGGLKPLWKVRVKYILALADYLDYNVIDARRKLSDLSPEEEALFPGPISELSLQLEARSLLDFQALRSERRAFVEIGEYNDSIRQLELNAEGTWVAVMYQDGVLKLLHTENGSEAASFSDNKALYEQEKAGEAGLAFSPDSRYLAVGLAVGLVKVYDLQERRLLAEYACPGLDWEQLDKNAYYEEYTHVRFSATGRYLVIVPTASSYDPQGDDGYPIPEPYRTFTCIDSVSGQIVLQHTFDDESKIAAIAMSPDEKRLAVGLFGKRMTVWDVQTGQCVYEEEGFVWLGLPSRVGMTQTIAFSGDSQKLFYAARDSVRIICLADGSRTGDIPLPGGRVCCALGLDTRDRVVVARYRHNTPSSIVRYGTGYDEEEMSIERVAVDVEHIWMDEERDEMWVYASPVLQVRKYGSGELIQTYDPYQWAYSPYLIGNTVSFAPKAGMAAISFGSKIRLI
ncbi:hypothetical protein WMW72_23310 [Paenibacillus filicis]|uniref:WD40 repeat domain-containing protein n=1 Tax=Paenibacillus filicis TaxID=669464 RepID=A0ABU9DPP3_9BACL